MHEEIFCGATGLHTSFFSSCSDPSGILIFCTSSNASSFSLTVGRSSLLHSSVQLHLYRQSPPFPCSSCSLSCKSIPAPCAAASPLLCPPSTSSLSTEHAQCGLLIRCSAHRDRCGQCEGGDDEVAAENNGQSWRSKGTADQLFRKIGKHVNIWIF